jgi:hypothetical protein
MKDDPGEDVLSVAYKNGKWILVNLKVNIGYSNLEGKKRKNFEKNLLNSRGLHSKLLRLKKASFQRKFHSKLVIL